MLKWHAGVDLPCAKASKGFDTEIKVSSVPAGRMNTCMTITPPLVARRADMRHKRVYVSAASRVRQKPEYFTARKHYTRSEPGCSHYDNVMDDVGLALLLQAL